MNEETDQVEGEVDPSDAELDGVAGMDHRYMTFELDHQFYGIELASVQEIVRAQRATQVPDVPSFVRGVINLRGTVVPVVDVRRRMGMEPIDTDERTCVIVCSFRGEGIGLVVDSVCDVVQVTEEEIIESSSGHTEGGGNDEMIRGLVRQDDGVKILLNLDEVLADLGELESATAA